MLRGAGHRAGHFGPDPLARNDALLAQHPERVQVGLENGLLLLALVDVLLAQPHDCAQGLDVEAVGFGLAIDVADVVGDRLLFLLQALDALDESLELVLGEAMGGSDRP